MFCSIGVDVLGIIQSCKIPNLTVNTGCEPLRIFLLFVITGVKLILVRKWAYPLCAYGMSVSQTSLVTRLFLNLWTQGKFGLSFQCLTSRGEFRNGVGRKLSPYLLCFLPKQESCSLLKVDVFHAWMETPPPPVTLKDPPLFRMTQKSFLIRGGTFNWSLFLWESR